MKNTINKQDDEYIQLSITRGSKWTEIDRFLEDKEIIQQFIDTENFSISNDEQGEVYPSYHYEIKRILASTMKNYSEKEKIYSFYHALNLCNLYPIHKKNYIYFQKAFSLLIPRILTHDCHCGGVCVFSQTAIFVLCNVINKNIENENKFENIPYDNFNLIGQFIRKCASYGDRDIMYKKSDQFLKFKENNLFIELLAKNLPLYFESKEFSFDNTLSGILILLLASVDKREKDILKSINECNINNDSVKILKKYYELFQNNDINKPLIEQFNKKFR